MRTLDRAGDKDLDTFTQLESVVEAFDRLGVEMRRANLGGSGAVYVESVATLWCSSIWTPTRQPSSNAPSKR